MLYLHKGITALLCCLSITVLFSEETSGEPITPEECFLSTGDNDCYHSLPMGLGQSENYQINPAWPDHFIPTARLNLPVDEIRTLFHPYAAFCKRDPLECDMTGDKEITLSSADKARILSVNLSVNYEIRCVPDSIEYGVEEYWVYPVQGRGDCEDIALEKRRRLVAIGFPRGALRMAIGQHRQKLMAHAVLTVESTSGTYILDSENGSILLWYNTAYNFETRERPDGQWERYDQRYWIY